jgi:LacI family transcriptional regulator
MTTIRDVARHARVSVGTVSNVLNDSPLVRDETRARVLAAINNLNYHPKAVARSLSTQRTNTIGMVRTELRPGHPLVEPDPFIFDLIDGVSNTAIESGTGLTFWTIPVGPSEMTLYRRVVLGQQVDGLILFAVRHHDPRIAFLKKTDFPFVVFGHDGLDNDLNWIDVDGAYGIELAVQHLAELGHRRIGYISPPEEQYLAQQRWSGFVNGMTTYGLAVAERLVYEGDFTERAGEAGAQYLMAQDNPPTAIICNNDRMAFGAMRAIQSHGLTVGQDVSVVGFDDITLAQFYHPPLTTIRQPVREIGQLLFELLQSIIAGEEGETLSGTLVKPDLQVRESTGPVP